MFYEAAHAKECHTGAEIKATYTAARKRLYAAHLVPAPAPPPEPPTRIKSMPVPAVPVFITPLPALLPRCKGSDVIAAVILVAGMGTKDFHSTSRRPAYAQARQLACWFMRHYSALSLMQIAGKVGRDHTTVMHSIKRVTRDQENFAKRIRDVAAVLHLELPQKVPTP